MAWCACVFSHKTLKSGSIVVNCKRTSFSAFNRFLYLVFVATYVENDFSHKYVVENGIKIVVGLLEISGYSVAMLSQKLSRSSPRFDSKVESVAISINCSFSLIAKSSDLLYF